MDHDETSGKWKKISHALFSAPAPRPSEAFVRGVMARIEELEAPRESVWSLRWLAPTAAFAAATALLALSGVSPEPVSAEDLLLQDNNAETPSSVLYQDSEDIYFGTTEAR